MQSVAELGFFRRLTVEHHRSVQPTGSGIAGEISDDEHHGGDEDLYQWIDQPEHAVCGCRYRRFRDAPIEEYPGDPSSSLRVDSDMAGDIAAGMYEISSNAALSGSNVLTVRRVGSRREPLPYTGHCRRRLILRTILWALIIIKKNQLSEIRTDSSIETAAFHHRRHCAGH